MAVDRQFSVVRCFVSLRVSLPQGRIDRQTPAYDVGDDVDEALHLVVIEGQGPQVVPARMGPSIGPPA